jgi:trehalose synthase
VGRLGPVQRDELARALVGLGLRDRARPAAAALFGLVPEKAAAWVWRCHIDVSTPNPATIAKLLPHIRGYPQSLFHVDDYVPAGMEGTVHVVPPAIDPLAPKNMALSPEDASYVCNQFGIDVDRPLLSQVSRFDPWKDPLGVIDAYRIVKERVPDVQLALVGSMASDDPEGWDFFNATDRPRRRRSGHPHPQQLQQRRGDRGQRLPVARRRRHPEVDARGLRPDGQRGDLEGTTVHRRDVGGIPLQVQNGISGYLVGSVDECAERCRDILEDPALGKALGRRGKEHVRKHFLMPRYLRDYLKIISQGLSSETPVPLEREV